MWDGAILLAGAISDGRSILAAQVLGADFCYMGTRFAATAESLAPPAYKELLVSQQMADSITTDRISGMSATFLRGSIEGAGLDPDNLPPRAARFGGGQRDAVPRRRYLERDPGEIGRAHV